MAGTDKQQFADILEEMRLLQSRKDDDYDGSFHRMFQEEGMPIARMKITDKYNRFKALSKGEAPKVAAESLEDTLIDMACYAVMTIVELRGQRRNEDAV